ncbi:MAG: hypothetical protein ACI4VQ_04815 [Clostridia bacterium]
MNGNDYAWWFAVVSLFNTSLGLSNVEKNTEQEERQKRIEQKLDEILEMLRNE